MKLLRETIRKLLKEMQHPTDSFIEELSTQFEDRGVEGMARTYPDGCEVLFQIEPTGGVDAYFHSIETIGNDCLRKGYARDTMESICQIADKYSVFITLEAEPFGGGRDMPQAEDLLRFYTSLGFKSTGDNLLDRSPR